MGQHCKICCRRRPHESFSGSGHVRRICKRCMRRPKKELQSIDEQQEIGRFLEQSSISQRNLNRLATLAASPNPEIARTAKLVLEIGKACPRKRKRLQKLKQDYKDLVVQLEETGLIAIFYDDF